MKEIQTLPTFYAGTKFRSRLEARWAIFFDHCGIKWEYEPEGYLLEDGTCYLPDFLLHGLVGRVEGDLFVEVKGALTSEDSVKIESFLSWEEIQAEGYTYSKPKRPLLVLGNIFAHGDESYFDRVCDACKYPFFTHETLDGDCEWPAILCGYNNGSAMIKAADGEYQYPYWHHNLEDDAFEAALYAQFSRSGKYTPLH